MKYNYQYIEEPYKTIETKEFDSHFGAMEHGIKLMYQKGHSLRVLREGDDVYTYYFCRFPDDNIDTAYIEKGELYPNKK